jgi:hypothetical protein
MDRYIETAVKEKKKSTEEATRGRKVIEGLKEDERKNLLFICDPFYLFKLLHLSLYKRNDDRSGRIKIL